MATHRKTTVDEMKKNVTQPAPAKADEGWEDHSRWDFDGFWKIAKDATLQGTIVDVRAIHDDEGKTKLVYVVQLNAPAQVTRDGDVETAQAGEVIGCGENFGLRPLRDIFGAADKPLIRVKAVDQKKLSGGRTLWTFKVQSRGGTPRKRPLDFEAILGDSRYAKGDRDEPSNGASEASDDIPF